MPLIAASARHVLRIRTTQILRQRLWNIPHTALTCAPRRCFYDGGQNLAVEEVVANAEKGQDLKSYINEYKTSFTVPKPNFQFNKSIPLSQIGETVTAVGFIGKRRDISRALTFVPLYGGNGLEQVQIFARSEINDEARKALRRITENSAVSVTGVVNWKYEAKAPRSQLGTREEGHCFINEIEIRVQRIDCLNKFPKELKLQPDQEFEAKYRHLQIRFDEQLKERLRFRSEVAAFARNELSDFQEVETPILFKSTPEGAREFIVPTRRLGYAYGLPQSPQQYKQILMASGIHRYVQFAKCFRDEDHRADRQPEFTQIDLEMAWADGEDVMQRVEHFMKALWKEFAKPGTAIPSPLPDSEFPRMTYDEAMSKHGSDKPDLRIKHLIHRIDHVVPDDLRSMLTSVENPIIEACKIRLNGDTATVQKFIRKYMDSPDAEEFRSNVAGAPGVFVVNLRRPLEGLQPFGFEGAEALKRIYADTQDFDMDFEEGDLLLLQARENLPHSGGSTMFGKLRLAVHKAALSQGLIDPDNGHHFLWVTDFPMFTVSNGSEPGQEGDSGFSATHHPFTAPKTAADVDMLLTNPLNAIADHYDLVLNGVELGGGSRRIHSAEMQKFIMREILKINPNRMSDFSHLFLALGAGCPPHAGLAIGFDRLIAVMQGRDSVRDVIAFPKDKNGTDLMVKSPSKLSKQRMADYHLQIKDDKINMAEAEAREVEAHKAASLESLKLLLDTIAERGANFAKYEEPTADKPIIDEQPSKEVTSQETPSQQSPSEETVVEGILNEEIDSEKFASEEIEAGEAAEESLYRNIPRYSPGELLPYAVMLYNQVGGNFLYETLKGFETLIESLGEEIQKSTGFVNHGGPRGGSMKMNVEKRLKTLHSELMDEILNQMHHVASTHSASAPSQPTKDIENLRSELEDAIGPIKHLQFSLKAIEPMLESLNRELDRRIQEHTERLEAVRASDLSDGLPLSR